MTFVKSVSQEEIILRKKFYSLLQKKSALMEKEEILKLKLLKREYK